ncbi:putative transposase, MuDR, plant, MULE transposase domain-containing protein [Rosa chinensis]|uniref:Putative transposase, MuDR, plant, MULE transposase domain-containing protein n=1 Tax=Rosa chinensis TaxID=74649 RepID=A0A2P6R9K8_ROSCH|nr:uncharacterized protein LOC112191254 [Rosa chinensis]XP_024186355.1 uncharacterized protein LOC112191254 [Rosa chinensis]XP_024186356.1 uncharacterized protein LOC112191254 [Rosa chinensis]XP_024186357.1 uncharacterized protein LOC112191254 [Rosa chinensis]XP_040373187.1 uncharacterized protein LOC112191254 [Rosa chinensis]PRQ43114.1 putative transposase, MuDR, plant, MULE transposase domain-containing protein [Rosa chinensis]
MYWFLLPGSIQGEGWLPICEDKDVLDMLKFMPSNRILQIYIVGGGVRKKKEAELEDEGGGSPKEVDHQKYIGNVVEDLEEVIDGDLGVTTLHGAKVSSKASGKRNKGGRPKNKKDVVTHLTNQFINVKASETIAGDNLVAENRKRPRMKQKACKMKKKSRPYETRFMGEKSFAEVEGIQEEPESSDSDDPNFEDLVDSDYDLDDNDDEFLFKANADGDPDASHEFNEMGFAGDISDGEGEDSEKFDSGTDSTATEDEEERIQSGQRKKKKRWSKWREFQKEDMKNPQFELGMSFPNSDVFKDAVRVFSVKTKKLLTFKTNDRKRVEVVCITSEGCPFRIWASVNGKVSPTFYIKTINMEHKCSQLTRKNYHCNAPFIAKGYIDSFMVDKNWSREGIQAAVQRDYGMTPGYQMCYRAKKRAARIAEGTVEDQYNLLESYAAVLKKTNPNTSVWIERDVKGENVRRFKRIYICFGAMKKGWIEGCRPIIGVDGCHLKTVHKGQLLTAVGIDGNNFMYPIAWAVVEKETREAWTWFFKFLKDDLCLVNDYTYVFMSDKQKGYWRL